MTIFDNELAINLVILINGKLYDISFITYSPFLSILAISFSTGTVSVMYFSVFSAKQGNSYSVSSPNCVMMK